MGKLAHKTIVHVDMDAFFASIEQRDRPELKNLPVIVGGSPDRRGVVSTCSYEARKYGIHSAMPTRTALRLCPQAVLIRPNHRKYSAVSRQIREIFHKVTDWVEPVSIDEAYLDITQFKVELSTAREIAEYIRSEIRKRTALTCSAGVAANKFLAKTASDFQKPDGLTIIGPEEADSFLDRLPIRKFHGIGSVTADRLESINVRTGADLKKLDLETLQFLFGKAGSFYYHIVRGIDDRKVETAGDPKSISREITLLQDCTDPRQLRIVVRTLARKTARRAAAEGWCGFNITLKIKYADFQTVTRTVTLETPTADGEVIGTHAVELLKKTSAGIRPVRLAGVGLGALHPLGESLPEQPKLPFKDS
ncbi:MAG: DNA polymerase IV [Lentisphaeria bacterium]|nr:DNA polymerase IV [Lentisphaeria bacterium]